jgi:hypothetical protein
MAPGLYGLMGTLPPGGAHLSGRGQLILRITEKKTRIQDMYIFTDQNLISLSGVFLVRQMRPYIRVFSLLIGWEFAYCFAVKLI